MKLFHDIQATHQCYKVFKGVVSLWSLFRGQLAVGTFGLHIAINVRFSIPFSAMIQRVFARVLYKGV